MTWEDGTKYYGHILNGLPHGRGTAFYGPKLQNKVYAGNFVHGVPNGDGILQMGNDIHSGNFTNGKLTEKIPSTKLL